MGELQFYRLISFNNSLESVNYSQPGLAASTVDRRSLTARRADVIPSSLASDSHMPACKHTCSYAAWRRGNGLVTCSYLTSAEAKIPPVGIKVIGSTFSFWVLTQDCETCQSCHFSRVSW